MSNQFAVFDIDGTLIRWQLYHAIADGLVKRGMIDAKEFEKVREARMNWKRRSGEEGFRKYEKQLVEVFDAALPGLPVQTFSEAADAVFKEYKDQVYRYSRDLIRKLKSEDYLLFAISGSPALIVEKMARYYGFDDFAATEYDIENGKFVGTLNLAVGQKPELLKKLVAKHGASFAKSVGVGDSEGDMDMLELVDIPIALNPSKLLFKHAQNKGWKIVLERKNVVYELEKEDGSYRLN